MSKPDAIEQSIPDVKSALALLNSRDPAFVQLTQDLKQSWCDSYPAQRRLFLNTQNALWLAYARIALRHGTWGDDFHAYHNEMHARDILSERIVKVQNRARPGELAALDVVLLALFAVTHDLRQREEGAPSQLVGPNERASQDEAHRILCGAGFDPESDQHLFSTLDLMIAGSTFVSDPQQKNTGATAVRVVESQRDSEPQHQQLVLLAADLDTANVSEPFVDFARGAAKLFEELEMRRGRKDLDTASAGAALEFLTFEQKRYFFELQRYSSDLGRRTFAEAKTANAKPLSNTIDRLSEHFSSGLRADVTGQQVLDQFLKIASFAAVEPT